jgi:hypothetical protein
MISPIALTPPKTSALLFPMRLFFLLCGIACAINTASAAVIYSGLQNIVITTGNFDGVYVDLQNTNNATNHGVSPVTGWDLNMFMGGVGEYNQANLQPVRANSGDSFSLIQNLAFGTMINGSSTFASGIGGSDTDHIGFGAGKFEPGMPGYLGFRLTGPGGPMYGWVRMTLTFDDPGAMIHDWAFDDSGASILAGMVPEPSRALLMLLGTAGMILRRRRPRCL